MFRLICTVDTISGNARFYTRAKILSLVYLAQALRGETDAELAGYSKRAFMELLSKEGIPVINISPNDLDRELGR